MGGFRGFRKSEGGVFFLLLVILFSSSLCLGVDTNGSHLSSIGTRASVVTFWQEVWVEGREGSAAGAELGSSFVPAGEAQWGGSSTAPDSIWSRNTLKPCTWVTVQASCLEKFILKLFLSPYLYKLCYLLCLLCLFLILWFHFCPSLP